MYIYIKDTCTSLWLQMTKSNTKVIGKNKIHSKYASFHHCHIQYERIDDTDGQYPVVEWPSKHCIQYLSIK